MKIKQRPEDFVVEELTDVRAGEAGPYAFYRLEKSGWTTQDALQAIRRRWHIDPYRLSYGGLKDRHALTTQFLTIYHGPRRNLTHHTVQLTYLGQVADAYGSEQMRGNRFRLVIRALPAEAVPAAEEALREVEKDGTPNYFDDQRFGSVSSTRARNASPGDEFVAKALIKGDYEGALRLALTSHYEHDRGEQKKEKAILRAHWGDWATCKQRLPRGHARSLVDYLVHHPADFKGAVQRLRPDLRSLYLSAYQSYLWNRMLAFWLKRTLRADQVVQLGLRLGDVPAQRNLDDDQRRQLVELQLPLPSAQVKLDADDPRQQIMEEVVREENIELAQIKLRGLKKMFFSKGERPAVFVPENLAWHVDADDLNASRHKLTLSFDLPRGCYATMIVKRVTALSETQSIE